MVIGFIGAASGGIHQAFAEGIAERTTSGT